MNHLIGTLIVYNNLLIGCSSTGSVPISFAASAIIISAIPQAGNASLAFSIGPKRTKSPPAIC